MLFNRTTLWVTGGYLIFNNYKKPTARTNYVTLEEVAKGPPLPYSLATHCMIKVNDSLVLITGGLERDKKSTKKSNSLFWFRVEESVFEQGPPMIEKRFNHACGYLKTEQPESTLALVVGGGNRRRGFATISTELLDMQNLTNSWLSGPQYPQTKFAYSDGIYAVDQCLGTFLFQ